MEKRLFHRPVAILSLSVMLCLQVPVAALAQELQRGGSSLAGATVQQAVWHTTGINTEDYPCARAAIHNVFENRMALQDLSVFHPKRIFMWMFEWMHYITIKFVHFLKGIFNPSAIQRGLGNAVGHMQRGSNPFSGSDQAISNALGNASPRTKVTLGERVESIIATTTNQDGSCK